MHHNVRHGYRGTRTYGIWRGIKQRCDNPNSKAYPRYGGRGISYDPKWEDFVNFLADMGEAPEGLSIDRIDPNGNYCRENCRWVTDIEQQRNREEHHWVTYGGDRVPLSVACEKAGLPYQTVYKRLVGGMGEGQALSLPVTSRDWELHEIGGVGKHIGDWIKEAKISQTTYSRRRAVGMSVEDSLFTPTSAPETVQKFTIGEEVLTVPQIEKKFQIPATTFRNRVARGWDPTRAATSPSVIKRGQYVEFKGERKTVMEWATTYGMKYTELRSRIKMGWDIERALTTPLSEKSPRMVEFRGREVQLSKLSKEHGISTPALAVRLKLGWDIERALTEPLQKKS